MNIQLLGFGILDIVAVFTTPVAVLLDYFLAAVRTAEVEDFFVVKDHLDEAADLVKLGLVL